MTARKNYSIDLILNLKLYTHEQAEYIVKRLTQQITDTYGDVVVAHTIEETS